MAKPGASPASPEPAPVALLFTDPQRRALVMRPLPLRRLGQWKVKVPQGGLPGNPHISDVEVPLSYVLLLMNTTPLISRYPVAVSSRGKAEDLHSQILSRGMNAAIPVAARKDGRAWLCWLDRTQFDVARQIMGCDPVLIRRVTDSQAGDPGPQPPAMPELHSGEQMGGYYTFEEAQPIAAGQEPVPYRDLLPEWAGAAGGSLDGLWQVAASPDNFSRGGQAVVRIARKDSSGLRERQLVVVCPALPPGNGKKIATLASLRIIEASAGETPGRYRYLQVDQSIRDALGIEIGETARIVPCKAPRRLALFDWLISRPTYVMCRVQSADSATYEREVSLVGNLTLELLGVESGDTVVVEGIPDLGQAGHPRVPAVQVKAFQISDEVLSRRERLSGGDLTCRFPNSRDSLGTFPDLPWIFLDSAERAALGLAGQKLGIVRVRASRWYQMQKEFREVLLIVAIAFIGILSMFRGAARYVLAGALVFLIIGVVALRLGSRLSRKLKPPVGPVPFQNSTHGL